MAWIWHSEEVEPLEDPMPKWWIAAGVAVVAATGALVFALWPYSPTNAECEEMFQDSTTGGKFPDECSEWFNSAVDEIQVQADAITACKDAVVVSHGRRWTPELEFVTTEIEQQSSGDFYVTGAAESVNDLGERWEWVYECTVSTEDGIKVLTAGTERV